MCDGAATDRMASRTLVAYERADGYDIHYAHDLTEPARIGAETPYGGPAPPTDPDVRDALCERGLPVPDREGTAVDPDPLSRGVAWDALVAGLNYRVYERVVRVAADWTRAVLLVCFFGFGDRGGADRSPVGDGALVELDRDGDRAAGWFEGVKSATADAIACGVCDEADARGYLAGRLRAFAGDREVHVP